MSLSLGSCGIQPTKMATELWVCMLGSQERPGLKEKPLGGRGMGATFS